jgi:hypothetical protein
MEEGKARKPADPMHSIWTSWPQRLIKYWLLCWPKKKGRLLRVKESIYRKFQTEILRGSNYDHMCKNSQYVFA